MQSFLFYKKKALRQIKRWFRYRGGCACLSLLWIINAIWFYKQAFKVEPYPQQAEIRKYVIRSAIGAFN
ncbi:unnamed protein product [Rotaria socialis]|uniref:Uncharacterized protein n=1 Tax=Rotaria socialis TaxID=392032 RepID=A0A818HJ03_9BILA|nr:unnamed protein product [Rotaria socialis]